jgi:hypothetical protein
MDPLPAISLHWGLTPLSTMSRRSHIALAAETKRPPVTAALHARPWAYDQRVLLTMRRNPRAAA